MRTEFALLAIYNSTLIPLKAFAENELGIKLQTARNRIAAGTFPVPVIKVTGQPMVHFEDAAAYIDSLRGETA